MKEIDLTKCNNCRYKAKVDEVDDYGRICVETGGLVFLRSDKEDGYIASWHCDVRDIIGISGRKVFDFEIIPRNPETYKDWQVGDTVKNPDAVCYIGRVIFVSGDFVAIETDGHCVCYTREELFNEGYRLVLSDIEKQIIEERKETEWEPQDGDICYLKALAEWVFIKKDGVDKTASHIRMLLDNDCLDTVIACEKDIKELRPATEEEKLRLFNVMAKNGKRWNADKECVEDSPKPYEFTKGEPVLVRVFYDKTWGIGLYDAESNNVDMPYWVYVGYKKSCYSECIPYNEKTMHLLGTTEDYKEE